MTQLLHFRRVACDAIKSESQATRRKPHLDKIEALFRSTFSPCHRRPAAAAIIDRLPLPRNLAFEVTVQISRRRIRMLLPILACGISPVANQPPHGVGTDAQIDAGLGDAQDDRLNGGFR